MEKKHIFSLLYIVLALGLSWLIVLAMRPSTVWIHLFYFPIALAAWRWRARGGLIVGVIAGILAGPLLFMEVTENVNQMTMNWMIRLFFFSVFGAFLGVLVKKMHNDSVTLANHQKEIEIQTKFATVDGLTLIPNRRKFDEVLQEEFDKLSDDDTPLSLMMMDLDEFKVYNDTYGHLQGDECLKKVSSRIESLLRPGDFLARYGGEEFVLILPVTDSPEAREVAERIRKGVIDLGLPHVNSSVRSDVTLSIGLVTAYGSSNLNAKEMLGKADRALYQAKEYGRNRVDVYGEQGKRKGA
ncbi:hypothetical protein CEY16_13385 [Halalkalibacillus sediminis]|uniref:GGDEF domain-containing protein n=1 Tax=Halalkalibacillus sediminis TaxID=2018042 RepID=A0A2I0QR43_9BACI|nr:diguanylate cyclase [Halalkalibacillus sediminis]PKR76804.1 hypothetical protein CEY16_13385 [Halalkalibacillus sediminis]